MDAAESLSQFMRNGRPDANCLAKIIHDLDQMRLSAGGPDSRITIFGEMAVLLFQEHNVDAVLEVERIWSDLTRPLSFFTVCSYPIECFHNRRSPALFHATCAEHSAISHLLNE
jgi:hypothetical protein